MTSFTYECALGSAVLMAPQMLFIWALDTKASRINRYRSYDWTWRKISQIFGVSSTTTRRWSM